MFYNGATIVEDIGELYELEEELGDGATAVVYVRMRY